MKIDRLLKLCAWKCSAPVVVENPTSRFESTAWAFMSGAFRKKNMALVVAERGDEERVIPPQSLQGALLTCTQLEPNGWRVLVVEWSAPEFEGSVTLLKEEGALFIAPEYNERFGFVENIKDAKHKHIVREIMKQIRPHVLVDVSVFFYWAKDFIGINYAKLVIFDYKCLSTTV